MLCCHIIHDLNTFTAVRDVVIAFSAITGAIIAIIGLSSWKKQFKDKINYDLALKIMKAAYEIESAFRHVRNPFMSTAELESALSKADYDLLKRPSLQFAQMQTRYAYNIRMNKLKEALASFKDEILEARIIWNDDVLTYLTNFQKIGGELHATIIGYLDFYRDEEKMSAWEKYSGIIYGVYDGSMRDEFAEKYENVISDLRDYLQPHLDILK